MSTTVLNTKINEVENKISNFSSLVKRTDYAAKISNIEGKYFSAADYIKFTSDILDEKKNKKSNKSNIYNLVKKSDWNRSNKCIIENRTR